MTSLHEVPVGHIFRLHGCDACIFRKTGEWAFLFVVRCERHRSEEQPSKLISDMQMDFLSQVRYDPLAAMLEAQQDKPAT